MFVMNWNGPWREEGGRVVWVALIDSGGVSPAFLRDKAVCSLPRVQAGSPVMTERVARRGVLGVEGMKTQPRG